MNDLEAFVFFCVGLADFARLIGGSIVDKNGFKVWHGLLEYGVEACRQVGFDVVYGGDNCDFGHSVTILPFYDRIW